MAKEARISFNRVATGNVPGNWNNITDDAIVDADLTIASLIDISDASATGWDFSGSKVDTVNTTSTGWTSAITAAWVNAEAADDALYIGNSSSSCTLNFNNLDNAKTYQIDVYGAADSGTNRFLNVTIGGVDLGEQNVAGAEKTWQSVGITPTAGVISVILGYGASATSAAMCNALRIVEEAATGPVITGPGTAQEGVATSITGTDLATVTETALQDSTGTYSVVQSTALNGGNLDVTPRRSVIAPTPGNPQPGIPVTPDITSPSVTTPWANRWRVTDE